MGSRRLPAVPLSAGLDTPGTFCWDRDVPMCSGPELTARTGFQSGADLIPPELLEAAVCDLIGICATCSSGPRTRSLGTFSEDWRMALCHGSL